jgi:hypothetical protein
MTPSKKLPFEPAKSAKQEVELEDAVMVPSGKKDEFRVEVRRVRGVVVASEVLEESVSLPVARRRIVSWRSQAGGVHRGIK